MFKTLLFVCFLIAAVPGVFSQTSEADLIHVGDIVDVDVIGSSEYDWRGTVSIAGSLDGYIAPGDAINVACRDPSAVAAAIASSFSKVLREPKVEVRIVDRTARPAIVLTGAVRTPTRFRALRDVHLRELIVRAGGITDNSSGEITVLRTPGTACVQSDGTGLFKFKITDLLKGNSSADPILYSGDFVTVEQAGSVYVIGAVNNPRPVFLHPELTVSRAIASAGGLSKDADGGKAVIFRRDATGTTTVEVDIGKIKRGQTVDVALRPSDILDVAGKGGKKRTFPPMTAGNSSTAGSEMPLRVIEP